jgi:hypothetical protein
VHVVAERRGHDPGDAGRRVAVAAGEALRSVFWWVSRNLESTRSTKGDCASKERRH